MFCRSNAWTRSCINAKFSVECGNETRDAVSKILPYTGIMTNNKECFMEIIPKLSYLEDIFGSVFSQGKSVEESLAEIIASIQINTV